MSPNTSTFNVEFCLYSTYVGPYVSLYGMYVSLQIFASVASPAGHSYHVPLLPPHAPIVLPHSVSFVEQVCETVRPHLSNTSSERARMAAETHAPPTISSFHYMSFLAQASNVLLQTPLSLLMWLVMSLPHPPGRCWVWLGEQTASQLPPQWTAVLPTQDGWTALSSRPEGAKITVQASQLGGSMDNNLVHWSYQIQWCKNTQ